MGGRGYNGLIIFERRRSDRRDKQVGQTKVLFVDSKSKNRRQNRSRVLGRLEYYY
jgi:hypothetical protein